MKLMLLRERIMRGIRRRIIKYSSNPHPTSLPYITGDAFRALAQHIFDKDIHFETEKVRTGDIVFVQSDLLDDYFQNVHPKIHDKYILVTHNGDKNIDAPETALIDEKIIHWFAQNVRFAHPRLTPIPIGLENKSYANAGWPSFINAARKLQETKNGRILCAFTKMTNPGEREPALLALTQNPSVDQLTFKPTQREYFQILRKYSFVASPPGNGEDCHRTWEAIYCNTLPIVKNSVLIQYFDSLGIPFWIIKDWKEIPCDSAILETFHREIPSAVSDDSPLYFAYWSNAILKLQQSARQKL